MPISATYNVKGGTLAQYDKIITGLAELAAAPGGLAHIAAATPDGFLVCDIWESQEAFDNFAPNLGPHAEAAGIGDRAAPFLGHVENLIITEKINQMPAVAVIYSFPGMSVQQYHDVLSHVKFDALPESTRRAHIASETPEGMFVVSIWESEAAFRSFEPALRAAFEAANVKFATPVIGKIHRIVVSPDAALSARA
jgi:heme-degrading monooxygenase HmoA